MADPQQGLAQPPVIPPGEAEYNQRVRTDGQPAAAAWRERFMGSAIQEGAKPGDVDDYFGNAAPAHQGITDHVQNNLLRLAPGVDPTTGELSPDAHLTHGEAWQYGVNSGWAGTEMNRWISKGISDRTGEVEMPPSQLGPNASFTDRLLYGAGSAASNLIPNIAGFAVPGGLVAKGASGGGLATGLREITMDAYRSQLPGAPKTFNDVLAVAGHSLWTTAQSAAVGGLSLGVGGAAGGAVAKAGGGALLSAATEGTAIAATATGINAVETHKVPDAEDFLVNATLMVGLGAAGRILGAKPSINREAPAPAEDQTTTSEGGIGSPSGRRPSGPGAARGGPGPENFETVRAADGTYHVNHVNVGEPIPPEPTEGQLRIAHNLAEIYAKTGVTPWEATARAKDDPAYAAEILGQDHNGNPVTPLLRQDAPPDPTPMEPRPLNSVAEHRLQSQDIHPLNSATPAHADIDYLMPRLENPRGDAGVISKAAFKGSRGGAVGLYQVAPWTARQFGLKGTDAEITAQLQDRATNTRIKDLIVADLKKRYPNDTLAQLAGYNGGPGAANRLVKAGPGMRLEAIPDASVRGGMRFESVPAARDESHLLPETQHYLANARRIAKGGIDAHVTGSPDVVDGGAADDVRNKAEDDETQASIDAANLTPKDPVLKEAWESSTQDMRDRITDAVNREVLPDGKLPEDPQEQAAVEGNAGVAVNRYLTHPELLPPVPRPPEPGAPRAGSTEVNFEVAPHPDGPLAPEWKKLTETQQVAASQDIAHLIVPQVAEAMGLKSGWTLEDRRGGYEGKENHALALMTDDHALARKASNMLGYVLGQKEMMIQHGDYRAKGSEKTGQAVITLKPGTSAAQASAVYAKLGNTVSGYTLNPATGVMKILFGGTRAAAIDPAIMDAVREAAPGAQVDEQNVTFHNESDYPLTAAQQAKADILRDQARALMDKALAEGERPTAPGSAGSSAGAASRWANASFGDKVDEVMETVVKRPTKSIFGGIKEALNPSRFAQQWMSYLTPAREADTAMIKAGTYNRLTEMGVEDWFRQVHATNDLYAIFAKDGPVHSPLDRSFDPEGPTLQKVFEELKAAGGNERDFTAILVAKRTVEKANQGIDTGVSQAASFALANDPATAKYEPAIAAYQSYRSGLLDFYREGGMISASQQARMEELNTVWVSMRRLMGNDTAFNQTDSKGGLTNLSQVLRKMEGGKDRQIVEPLIAGEDNARQMIGMALKNKARQYVYFAAKEDPVLANHIGFQAVKVDDPNNDMIDRELLKAGFTEKELDKAREAFGPLVRARFDANLGENETSMYVDGRRVVFSVKDPGLAQLLRSSSSDEESTGFLAGFAALQRTGIVLDPAFQMRIAGPFHELNMWLYDPMHPAPFYTMATGIASVLKADDLFKEVQANGGLSTSIADQYRMWGTQNLTAEFEKQNVWQRTWNTFTNPSEFATATMHLAHSVARTLTYARNVGYYAFARSKGIEPLKAATASRKAGIDYSERAGGELANRIAKNAAFFRPHMLGNQMALQSLDRMTPESGRGKAAAALLTRAFVGLLVPNILLYAVNRYQDQFLPLGKRFKDISPSEKDNNFILPTINGFRLKLRVPGNLGPMLAGITWRTLDAMAEHDPHAFDGYLADIMETWIANPIPSFFQPALDTMTNSSFGSHPVETAMGLGRPMIPDSLKNLTPDQQYTANTTATAIALSKVAGPIPVLNSPASMEHLVQGYLGTAGIDTLRVLGAAYDKRPWDIGNTPVVGSFFARNPGMNSAAIDDFYKDAKDFQAQAGSFAHIKHAAAIGETVTLGNLNLTMVQANRSVGAVEKGLSMSRSIVEGIENNGNLTPDEKRQHVDAEISKAVNIAEFGVSMMHSIKSGDLKGAQAAGHVAATVDAQLGDQSKFMAKPTKLTLGAPQAEPANDGGVQ